MGKSFSDCASCRPSCPCRPVGPLQALTYWLSTILVLFLAILTFR